VRVFAFVSRQKAEFAVKTLCRVCRVSTSGYYDWEARQAAGPTPAQSAEQELIEQIRLVHKESRGRYGSPRMTAQLARDGVVVNHKRVERLMAREGLRGRCGRRRVRTTVADPKAFPAPDLVERRFEQQTLDVLWVGDVTYIPTDEGWLYLATVLDACSRRLLGWSLADHLRTELCLDALEAAVGCRGGKPKIGGVVFHSDRGCQSSAEDYRLACADLLISQSMGSVGDCLRQRHGRVVLRRLQARSRRRRALRHQGRGARRGVRVDHLVQRQKTPQLPRPPTAHRVRAAPHRSTTCDMTRVR
jgi:hypothetical protein